MMRLFTTLTFALLLFGSCGGGRTTVAQGGESDTIHYAKGFSVTRFDDFIEVEVNDPWDTTRLLQRYLLVDKSLGELPEGMAEGSVIRTPIDRLVVYTSVHASITELLGQHQRVIGVCEVRYIDSDAIAERIESGLVADLGESTSPNIEKIMDIGTEAILSSPFKDAGYGSAEKLGIPIIEGADYMEDHPLGRMEWIRFYGLLLGAEQVADSLFRATCGEYDELRELAASVTERPTVLAERKYGGQWFVPGGESFHAIILLDAGADYIFADEKKSGSIPFAFETVLDRAINADIWVMKYHSQRDLNYSDFKSEYAPYAHFDAFKNRQIYACNTGRVPYYEHMPMHPQRLLKEYIYIFHPQLLPHYTPEYFHPMKD